LLGFTILHQINEAMKNKLLIKKYKYVVLRYHMTKIMLSHDCVAYL
jgi:hypothetical protein